MDVSTLRADIKAWERLFRQQHARDPSIQEIKALPDIAEKYKLYKKLSKQPQPTHRSDSARDQPRPSTSSILQSTSKSKPRPVKVDPPAVTSNPFSPVKNKAGKHRAVSPDPYQLPIPSLLSSGSRANPFKTPTKSRPPREPRRAPEPPIQELEEDPFPLIVQPNRANSPQAPPSHHPPQRNVSASFTDTTEHPPAAASSSNAHLPRDKSAVTRARKRLRGEPVSPSPVKEKRPRVADRLPVQPALRFDTIDVSDDDAPVRRGEAYIEDTPAKPPQGKKQFKVLFDEAAAPAAQPISANTARTKEQGLSRTKSANGKGLFGFGFSSANESASRTSKSRALSPCSEHSDDEMDWDVTTSSKAGSAKLKAPDFSPSVSSRPSAAPKHVKNGAKIPSAMLPGKDDLRSATKSALESATSTSTRPQKRSISPTSEPKSQTTPRQAPATLPLLPPSPSQDAQQPKYIDKGKGRALARKKSKMLAEDEEDSEEELHEEDLKVKEMPWKWNRHRSQDQDILPSEGPEPEPDSEPDFEITHVLNSRPGNGGAPDEPEERFEVHLPDDLKRVLALSPPPHIAPEDEDQLVKGLLYGRRAHYDASRGGEVWGAGEFSSESEDGLELPGAKRKPRGEESEDEWEGEPLPWEVAEL
ncbi:hypothetical protein PsYK624_159330 [Phanerochaete sordida]|uniref:DNA replication regulator SLD2 n=1 Tax=Phanerochaete sordida TaxID=48140 RepID=A0A9P3GQ28_9APHY|nr:hypothetical protein PsYK624_159330 [Phanerochaete sordida]